MNEKDRKGDGQILRSKVVRGLEFFSSRIDAPISDIMGVIEALPRGLDYERYLAVEGFQTTGNFQMLVGDLGLDQDDQRFSKAERIVRKVEMFQKARQEQVAVGDAPEAPVDDPEGAPAAPAAPVPVEAA